MSPHGNTSTVVGFLLGRPIATIEMFLRDIVRNGLPQGPRTHAGRWHLRYTSSYLRDSGRQSLLTNETVFANMDGYYIYNIGMATILLGTVIALAGVGEYVHASVDKHHSKGIGIACMVAGVLTALLGFA